MAVALVVAYHLAPEVVPGGFLGVDVFFVLSGFLITSLLLDERREHGRIDLRRFYLRRMRRLAPALLLVVAGVALYAAVWATPLELDRLRGHSLWTLGYLANWHFIADGTTYTDLVAGQSPLRHTWSLAIEEQFYVLFPLLVVGLGLRRSWGQATLRRVVGVVAAAGAVASAAWTIALWGDGTQVSRGYFGTDTRAQQLLVGVVLGAALVGRPRPTGRLVAAAGWLGAATLAVAVMLSDERSAALQHGGFLVVALAAAGVIAAVERLPSLRRLLAWRPLVGLGLISYGVYLWHWPIIVLLDAERAGVDGLALGTLQVALTLGLATASFLAIERPVRHGALGLRLGRSAGWALPVAAAAAVLAVLASTVPPTTTTLQARSPLAEVDRSTLPSAGARVQPAPGGNAPDPAARPTPGTGSATVPLPSSPPPPEPLGVVVFGDSVAHTLAGGLVGAYPSFEPWAADRSPFDPSRVVLWSVAKPGCSFLPGRATIEGGDPVDLAGFCGDWRRDLDVALANNPTDLVLVALSNDATDRFLDGKLVRLGTQAHAALVADLLDEIRAAAGAHGAELALVLLPPRVGRFALEVDRSGERDEAMRAELGAYVSSRPGVRLADLSSLLCPGGDCEDAPAGFDPAWRYDGLHYHPDGARWVAGWLTAELTG